MSKYHDIAGQIRVFAAYPAGGSVADGAPAVSEIIDCRDARSVAITVEMSGAGSDEDEFVLTIEHGSEADLSDAAPAEIEAFLGSPLVVTGADVTAAETAGRFVIFSYLVGRPYARFSIGTTNAGSATIAAGGVAILGALRSTPDF